MVDVKIRKGTGNRWAPPHGPSDDGGPRWPPKKL